MMKKKFLPASIRIPSKKSKDQRYYLNYRVLNQQTLRYIRARDYISRKDFPTDELQLAEAERRKEEVNLELTAGTHYLLTGKKIRTKLEEAFDQVWAVWSQRLERRTINSYNQIFRFFFDYCKRNFPPDILFDDFTREMACQFADYIEINKKSTKTVLCNISLINTLFKKLMKREYIRQNPFENLDLPKENITRIRYIEKSDRNEIFSWLKKNDRGAYLYCVCIYYLLARPDELINVRIRDIKLSEQKIKFHHAQVKNDIDKMVRIPDAIMPVFLDHQLDRYNHNDYLFSKKFLPSSEPWKYSTRPGEIIRKYRKANKWKSDFVAYDLKPSGIQDYLAAGVPVDQVQLQAGISWEEMSTYLELNKMRMPGLQLVSGAMPLLTESNWQNNLRVKSLLDEFMKMSEQEKKIFKKNIV